MTHPSPTELSTAPRRVSKKLPALAALLTLCLLSGCGWWDRVVGTISGYSIICVEETHVQYVQFTSGAAVLVDKDGKPVPCK